MEITMRNLLASGEIDLSDFLARADALGAVGKTVLIPEYFEYYRLAAYLTDTPRSQSRSLWVWPTFLNSSTSSTTPNLRAACWKPSENCHQRFAPLRVSPADHATGTLRSVENAEIPSTQHHLFRHLVERGRIKQLDNFDESVLHIFSRDVLKRIKENDAAWEHMVPPEVAEMVKRRQLLGIATRK